jgi:VWFA-related protein
MRSTGILAACALLAAAQQSDEVRVSAHIYTPPQLRLTAQTQLVQLEVVVRDAHGRAVEGLKQADFEILDEGKPRTIAAFSVESRGQSPATAAPPESVAAPSRTASIPNLPAVAPSRSVLLFFDDLHGGAGELQRTQAAARRFIEAGLGPGARAAVFAASEGITLHFTSDADALIAAIDKLRSHERMPESGISPCPRISPYQAYLIANSLDATALKAALLEAGVCMNADPSLNQSKNLNRSPATLALGKSMDPSMAANTSMVLTQAEQTWQQTRVISLTAFDAIENAIANLARAPGTRVLLMASTGFISGMLDSAREAAIDHAIKAGVVINALDAKGLWSEAPGRPLNEVSQVAALPHNTFVFETQSIGSRNAAMNDVMSELAAGTGGLFFHDNNDLAGGFQQLGAVPGTTYLIAFHPDAEGAAGKYHKLKVRLTAAKEDYVQARPGYFAPANAPAETTAAQRNLDREAMASEALTEFPIRLAGRLGKAEKGDAQLSLIIHVDLTKLQFTESEGRHRQKLEFIGALLDAHGDMVAAKEGAMDLALKEETLARLTASGINATLTLNAPPGPYRVRVVVQEGGGRMAALNQTVEIPK